MHNIVKYGGGRTMKLFVNQNQVGLFKNPKEVEQCQKDSQLNTLTEVVTEQQERTKVIQQAVQEIKSEQSEINENQQMQWSMVKRYFQDFNEKNEDHRLVGEFVLKKLAQLEFGQNEIHQQVNVGMGSIGNLEKAIQEIYHLHKGIVTQFAEADKKIEEHFNEMTEVNKLMVSRMNELDTKTEKITSQYDQRNQIFEEKLDKIQYVNEQINRKIVDFDTTTHRVQEKFEVNETIIHQLNNKFEDSVSQLNERIKLLENNQIEMMDHIDCHGGILNKIIHQIDHVRSVLFERANFLEEKLERVYMDALTSFKTVVSENELVHLGDDDPREIVNYDDGGYKHP